MSANKFQAIHVQNNIFFKMQKQGRKNFNDPSDKPLFHHREKSLPFTQPYPQPQSFREPPPLPKNTPEPPKQKIEQKIRHMMDHIRKILLRLLDNLRYVYQSNGINFNVDGYFDMLIRTLTPYELLSHFHIVDNSQLFSNKQKIVDHGEFQCKFKGRSEKLKREMMLKEVFQRKQIAPKSNSNYENLKVQNSSQQNPLTIQSKALEQAPRNSRNKPTLSKKVQSEIANWIIEQLMLKRNPRLKDIATKSRQLAKGFKSSISWAHSFLFRHPYLKMMVKLCKKGSYDAVRGIYEKVKGEILYCKYQEFPFEEELGRQLAEKKRNGWLSQKISNGKNKPVEQKNYGNEYLKIFQKKEASIKQEENSFDDEIDEENENDGGQIDDDNQFQNMQEFAVEEGQAGEEEEEQGEDKNEQVQWQEQDQEESQRQTPEPEDIGEQEKLVQESASNRGSQQGTYSFLYEKFSSQGAPNKANSKRS